MGSLDAGTVLTGTVATGTGAIGTLEGTTGAGAATLVVELQALEEGLGGTRTGGVPGRLKIAAG
jgi:hypothetical protein